MLHLLALPLRRPCLCGTRHPHYAILVALFMLLTEGCATTTTPPPAPEGRKDLLEFLHVGETSREQVLVALGAPSWAFEHERILTYRLGYTDKQGYFMISPRRLEPWHNVRYSLVLVFDGNGVLNKRRMVDVK